MSDLRFVPVQAIRDLKEGDIIQNRGLGTGYVVTGCYGDYAIAVRTVHASNPSEWLVLRQRQGETPR